MLLYEMGVGKNPKKKEKTTNYLLTMWLLPWKGRTGDAKFCHVRDGLKDLLLIFLLLLILKILGEL